MNQQLGSVNPCGRATIYAGAVPIGECLDTPNALGLAFFLSPAATHAIAYYPGWAPERRTIDKSNTGEGITIAKAMFKNL